MIARLLGRCRAWFARLVEDQPERDKHPGAWAEDDLADVIPGSLDFIEEIGRVFCPVCNKVHS